VRVAVIDERRCARLVGWRQMGEFVTALSRETVYDKAGKEDIVFAS